MVVLTVMSANADRDSQQAACAAVRDAAHIARTRIP